MTTIEQFERQFKILKTAKLPPRVVIDDLGNTISASQYRRERADSLAREVSRIAWSGYVLRRAKALVSAARRYALLAAINAFMDAPVINAARHSSDAVDALACEIEQLMTDQGEFVATAAALLGKRGGIATSQAKAAASRENGKKGGRPKKSQS